MIRKFGEKRERKERKKLKHIQQGHNKLIKSDSKDYNATRLLFSNKYCSFELPINQSTRTPYVKKMYHGFQKKTITVFNIYNNKNNYQ